MPAQHIQQTVPGRHQHITHFIGTVAEDRQIIAFRKFPRTGKPDVIAACLLIVFRIDRYRILLSVALVSDLHRLAVVHIRLDHRLAVQMHAVAVDRYDRITRLHTGFLRRIPVYDAMNHRQILGTEPYHEQSQQKCQQDVKQRSGQHGCDPAPDRRFIKALSRQIVPDLFPVFFFGILCCHLPQFRPFAGFPFKDAGPADRQCPDHQLGHFSFFTKQCRSHPDREFPYTDPV